MVAFLKTKLVALRLAHYGARLPEAPRLASGRLDELVSSLHSVLLHTDRARDREFREAVAEQIERHTADEGDCLEAELAEALSVISPDEGGRVAVPDVVEALGWDPGERRDAIKAGGLLKHALGLRPGGRLVRDGKKAGPLKNSWVTEPQQTLQ